MFARVITAQAGTQGFDSFIRVAREQLPGARQQPGFKGYYVLTDPESGKIIIISLWESREQMEAVGAAGRPAFTTRPSRRPDSPNRTSKPTTSPCTNESQPSTSATGRSFGQAPRDTRRVVGRAARRNDRGRLFVHYGAAIRLSAP